MDDLDDAIVEDTVHCDLCGGSFLVGDNGPVMLEADTVRFPGCGKLGGQLKLCHECAMRVHDAYRDNLREACICEHGINDGEYYEDCNREYKRARGEN